MYYLIYGLLYAISLLPMFVLYGISNVIYVLLFYVFKYRKPLVKANLKIVFPNKSEAERLIIAKQFYKNFIDSFVETIKLFSTGKNFINSRCEADYSLFEYLYKQGKPFQIHACHQFNWEIINYHFSIHAPQTILGVYMPLSNKSFERIFLKIRQRYNTTMLPATEMKNKFTTWRTKPHALVLVADQNPGHPKTSYWFNFFGKPTPFIIGPERYARDKNCPVLFAKSIKLSRGKYKVLFELVTENAAELAPTQLTQKFVQFITNTITEQPENWLWSHRRFKWNWQLEYGEVLG